MMNRRWVAYCLILVLAVMAGGCGKSTPPPPVPDEPEDEPIVITIFFGDLELVNTGQVGEYGYLVPVQRTIGPDQDPAAAVVAELIRGPVSGEDDLVATVPSSAVVLSVTVADGTVVVDFSSGLHDENYGGSLAGILFISSMLYSLTELDGIDAVHVLIEGEYWHDGHFIWDEPLRRQE